MALRLLKLTRQCTQLRQVHQSATTYGFFDLIKKPMPRVEDTAVGYSKIAMESKEVGDDPFEMNRDQVELVTGTGTKSDPFMIPSRNTRRFVAVPAGELEGGPPSGFWVTLEDGGRCPFTARYYKLKYDPEDKWGVDKLDLFAH